MLRSNDTKQWREQFTRERMRLLTVLGALTEGGIVEDLQHIGATSVSWVPTLPCIDIGLAVWPFPLEPHCQAAVEALGYELVSESAGAPEQRFRHTAGTFQLYMVEAGSERWTSYLLIRDYLQHDEAARQTYATRKQALAAHASTAPATYQTAKAQLLLQTLEAAREWWVHQHGFASVAAVAQELQAFHRPWYIASGWALDLFLGRVTRVHHDVDVVVARTDQLALQHHLTARGWKLVTPLEGRLEPWPVHMQLELPRHQVHAHRDGAFIDFLLSDIADGMWRYRRNPVVIRTADRMCLYTAEGIPFLAPELVLLFKSKNTSGKERSRDQADFAAVSAHLEPERRAWLRWALLVTDPAHPWIEQLV